MTATRNPATTRDESDRLSCGETRMGEVAKIPTSTAKGTTRENRHSTGPVPVAALRTSVTPGNSEPRKTIAAAAARNEAGPRRTSSGARMSARTASPARTGRGPTAMTNDCQPDSAGNGSPVAEPPPTPGDSNPTATPESTGASENSKAPPARYRERNNAL